MLDLSYLRANLEEVERRLALRGGPTGLDRFREKDRERRATVPLLEMLRMERNVRSEEVGKLRQAGQDTTAEQASLRELGDKIKPFEEKAKEYDAALDEILRTIPNVPHESAPVGRSSEENVEVRRWRQPREMNFTPKPHWDLGPGLGILDFDRAAKITGARFAVYWGIGCPSS